MQCVMLTAHYGFFRASSPHALRIRMTPTQNSRHQSSMAWRSCFNDASFQTEHIRPSHLFSSPELLSKLEKQQYDGCLSSQRCRHRNFTVMLCNSPAQILVACCPMYRCIGGYQNVFVLGMFTVTTWHSGCIRDDDQTVLNVLTVFLLNQIQMQSFCKQSLYQGDCNCI